MMKLTVDFHNFANMSKSRDTELRSTCDVSQGRCEINCKLIQGKYLLQKRKQPNSSITQISTFFTLAVIYDSHMYHSSVSLYGLLMATVQQKCAFILWFVELQSMTCIQYKC